MRRVRILTAAALAVFAFSAIVSASAMAVAPEFSVLSNKFTATGSAGTLEGGGVTVTCTGNSSSGEVTSAANKKMTAIATLTYTGCKSGANPCSSSGAASGEIQVAGGTTGKTLEGTLIYAGASKTKPAERIKPVSPATKFVEFKCGILTVPVQGEVIGAVSPINVSQLTGTLTFKQSKGKQELQTENGAGSIHLVAFGGLVESGLESTEAITFAKAEEVKA